MNKTCVFCYQSNFIFLPELINNVSVKHQKEIRCSKNSLKMIFQKKMIWKIENRKNFLAFLGFILAVDGEMMKELFQKKNIKSLAVLCFISKY